jgi:hypothetical protein
VTETPATPATPAEPAAPATPATPARLIPRRWRRRVVQLLAGLYLVASLVCASLVVNAALSDISIARDRGSAIAEVVSTGGNTVVRYTDEQGRVQTPQRGLKYPTGLQAGQRVRVEYQRSDPDNVKVAGRGWTLALLPALSSWLVVTAVAAVPAGVLWWRWRR